MKNKDFLLILQVSTLYNKFLFYIIITKSNCGYQTIANINYQAYNNYEIKVDKNVIQKMVKKLIVSATMLSLLVSGIAFAETTTTTPKANTEGNIQLSSTALTCIVSAVAARESAIQSAFNAFHSSVSAAFSARATSLAAAWAMIDKTARNTAIKSAWSTFKQAFGTARKTYNTARADAWSQFSSSRKACKAPATGENPGSEAL